MHCQNTRIQHISDYLTIDLGFTLKLSGYGFGLYCQFFTPFQAEIDDGELPEALARLQRQMKSGLTSLAALGFFEAGFADRIVAQALAARFPDVSDRQSARLAVRNANAQAREIVGQYPGYFVSILDELLV
jgi:hypothetical protein